MNLIIRCLSLSRYKKHNGGRRFDRYFPQSSIQSNAVNGEGRTMDRIRR